MYKNKPYCLNCEKILTDEFVGPHKALNHRVEIYSFAPYKSDQNPVQENREPLPAPKEEEKINMDLAESYEEEQEEVE